MVTNDAVDGTLRTPETLEQLARALGMHASANAVFGEAVRHNGVTVIPVGRASIGCGRGGSRDGKTPGPNMGGGAIVKPIGYIEIRDGQVSFRHIGNAPGTLWAGVAAGVVAGLVLPLLVRGRR